jgi:hypothetical protein
MKLCRIAIAVVLAAAFASAAPFPAASLRVTSLETGASVTSPVPPQEVLVDKDVPWTTVPGDSEPTVQSFGVPKPRTVAVTLVFEGSGQPTADPFVDGMQAMAAIDPSLKRPPIVEVKFGALTLTGVIDKVSIEYAAVPSDGTRPRTIVRFAVREASAAIALERP